MTPEQIQENVRQAKLRAAASTKDGILKSPITKDQLIEGGRGLADTREMLENAANYEKISKEREEAEKLAEQEEMVRLGLASPAATPSPAAPAKEVAGANFADPSTPTAQRSPADTINPTVPEFSTQKLQDGFAQQSAAISEGQVKADQIYQQRMQELDALNKQTEREDNAVVEAEKEMRRMKTLQAEQAKLKPEARDYFSGKTTFQKIMAGIGLALASITPQGAQNALKIIDSEIDRDLDIQKMNYEAKGKEIEDTKGNYRAFMDQYKDARMARMAAKADAIQRLKLDLDVQAQKTSSSVAKGKLLELSGKAQLEVDKYEAALRQATLKAKKEEAKGKIQGYEGVIEDPTAARQIRTMVAEKPGTLQEIDNLVKINDQFLGGTFSTDSRASADQSQNLLLGNLRTTLVGPGPVSDSERKILQDAIANPTKFFSLGSSNKIRLRQLKAAYLTKLNANLRVYGLKKIQAGEIE